MRSTSRHLVSLSPCHLVILALALTSPPANAGGTLKISVVEKETGKPIPFRMHLKNHAGVAQRIGKLPFWHDHIVSGEPLELSLRNGNYFFEIERGLEYLWQQGHFTIENNAQDEKTIELRRFINMPEHGWYSGDLHVQRPAKDIELLMRADDLHVAPLVSWTNKKNEWAGKELPKSLLTQHDGQRFYHLLGGKDERLGGSFLYFGLTAPLDLGPSAREFPPALPLTAKIREQGGWIDAEKPNGWDLPAWVAAGQIDGFQLAHSGMGRVQMAASAEAAGRPRDPQRFRPPLGGGFYTQQIYYHLLNCGLRIPPSAGSGTGVVPNPLGYNRVYVHVEGEFTYEKWWEGLRAGRSFVTNGPLLRPDVDGQLPGHTFSASVGETITVSPVLSLSTRDKVAYLEIVKNGEAIRSIRLDEYAKLQGKLPPLTFDKSGWFLIRAIAETDKTFRFASTAPYYVKIGDRSHISKASAQFFVDWVEERIKKLELSLSDPGERTAVLAPQLIARKFWADILGQANEP